MQQFGDLELSVLERKIGQVILAMESSYVQLRQAVAVASLKQERTQKDYVQAKSDKDYYYQKVQIALQEGQENLAQEFLTREKAQIRKISVLEKSLEQQATVIGAHERKLTILKDKIFNARSRRDALIARAAKASERLQENANSPSTGRMINIFEQMEEKVLQMEACSQAVAKLADVDLQSQFDEFFSRNDVDEELAAIKDQLLGKASFVYVRPPGTPMKMNALSDAAVDAELEALKAQLDQL